MKLAAKALSKIVLKNLYFKPLRLINCREQWV